MTNAGPCRAVLFDFGGVLTSSVLEAFAEFGRVECSDGSLPLKLSGTDARSQQLLTDHEEGRLEHDDFEVGFSAGLRDHGVEVEADRLIATVRSWQVCGEMNLNSSSCMVVAS